MKKRITLARHGKPAFELKGSARARDLSNIARLYDESGITGAPPEETVLALRGNPVVVCSHLLRSIESAQALGYQEIHVQEPLFRETAIPHFRKGPISLPVGAWVVILRILWVLGFSRNGESLINARVRAREAASRLVQLAQEHQAVLLVGHGFINHFIAKELRKSGWFGPSKPGRGYWEYGVYEQATTSQGAPDCWFKK